MNKNLSPFSSLGRCAVLVDRIGPYHFARFSALATQLQTRVIESVGMDATYAWAKVTEEGGFERETLFESESSAPGDPAQVSQRVFESLDRFHPDVVAIPGWGSTTAFAALSWCLRTNTPRVVMSASTVADEPRQWWKESLKSQVVRLFSAGLGGGTPHVDYLASLGIPRDRLFQGYDVVDNDHFARGADSARANEGATRAKLGLPEKYFMSVTRFVTIKNLERLIEAYARYRAGAGARAWKFVLIGDGPLKPRLFELQRELGLVEDLIMPGWRQYPDLPSYYGLASAFVLASNRETWGLVVNEAMAAGLPVIVSKRCGCACDLVENGRNGFTFDPTDGAALTALMLRMSSGELHLAKMSQASRASIARWSPQTFATNLCRAGQVAQRSTAPRVTCASRVVLSTLLRRSHRP